MNEIINGEEAKHVYKTIQYQFPVNEGRMRRQQLDGLIMERTVTSHFIPDILGFCGIAQLMEYMPAGNLNDYFKHAQLAGGSTLAPVDKLRLAIHLASGVAALHTMDGTARPAFFHNDLSSHQFLFGDGYFQLNDFHMAEAILVDRTTGETCPPKRTRVLQKNSPPEQHQLALRHPDYVPANPATTTNDVWMLGNVIYTTLTDWNLFPKPLFLNLAETSRELVAGRRSPYPKLIQDSRDPSHMAMKQAVEMCWTHNATARPTASSVTEYLLQKLREITGEDAPELRVVLPARAEDPAPTSDN